MTPVSIDYLFTLPDKSQIVFHIQLDPEDLSLISAPQTSAPPWTDLVFHQCPNCPLKPETHPKCPLAASLTDIVADFEKLASYDRVSLEVKASQKAIRVETSVQEGVGSLMGLVIATSGCPHMVYFRPMARFHVPLADEEETIYRAASMYLLAQFFRKRAGRSASQGLPVRLDPQCADLSGPVCENPPGIYGRIPGRTAKYV